MKLPFHIFAYFFPNFVVLFQTMFTLREICSPFPIFFFCLFVKYDPTSFNTFVFREAGLVIILDPNNFSIPVNANPERAPVANGATILLATGIYPRTRQASAPKNPPFLL